MRSHLTRGARHSQWPGVALAAGLAAVGLWSGCTSGPAPVDDRPYEAKIQASRAEKDAAFKSPANADSPIPAAKQATYTGLAYFPIDSHYRVPAFVKEDRTGPPVIISLQTSTTEIQHMRRVGPLGFTLGDASYSLTAFTDADSNTLNRLFVPFADLTSGTETYKGGRYIELDRTPTGLYDLDFNRAYHPFCVYNTNYSCPVPPKENRLTLAIRAGEKLSEPH
jgi:uncharacterized protein (DUF1684 family)